MMSTRPDASLAQRCVLKQASSLRSSARARSTRQPSHMTTKAALNGVNASAPVAGLSNAMRSKLQPAPLMALHNSKPEQTTVYDNAAYASLPVGSISAPVRTYDSYIVNPSLPTTASLPTGVARIVDGARKLFEVRTMQEHKDVMRHLLAQDVAYQAPIISTYSREDMRVAAYLAKSIAYMTLEPYVVEVVPAGHGMSVVQVDGTVVVALKRSWLFPPSLLVPDIPIRATIKLGVRDGLDVGKVEFIGGRWHNLPSAPGIICRFNGFIMGTLMHWVEPLWSRGLWLVGDLSTTDK